MNIYEPRVLAAKLSTELQQLSEWFTHAQSWPQATVKEAGSRLSFLPCSSFCLSVCPAGAWWFSAHPEGLLPTPPTTSSSSTPHDRSQVTRRFLPISNGSIPLELKYLTSQSSQQIWHFNLCWAINWPCCFISLSVVDIEPCLTAFSGKVL